MAMKTMHRRQILGKLAGWTGAALTPWWLPVAPASAQTAPWSPNKPITLLVPWPAGGATDLTMRVLADLAGRRLGQRVLVENRPGAGGTLAMPVLQQAAPDGYTLAQMPQPVFRAPHLQHTLWDPIRDTTPILQVSGVTFGVLVPAASPLRRMEDLFQFAKAHPDELTVATNGIGTTPHLVMEELFGRKGLRFTHVPYKGTSEQMIALTSGQVMVGVNSNGFAPFLDSGKLRMLATFGARRSPRWPQVPTLKELGLGLVASSPYGIVGPRALPPPIVKTLHDAFHAALFDPVHLAELAKYDQLPDYLDSVAYGRAMQDTAVVERRAAERLGLTGAASK